MTTCTQTLPQLTCSSKNPFLIEIGVFHSVYQVESIDGLLVPKYKVFANVVVGREQIHKYERTLPRYKSKDVLLFEVIGETIEESFIIANNILSGIE